MTAQSDNGETARDFKAEAEARRTKKAIDNLTKALEERKAKSLTRSSLSPSAPETDGQTTNQQELS